MVSIGLGAHDDPQQIFESLNATGRPLTESEKLKNWLLMGWEDAEQQELHDRLLEADRSLAGCSSTRPIRSTSSSATSCGGRPARLRGAKRVYEDLRRWARSDRQGRGSTDAPRRSDQTLPHTMGVLTGASKHAEPACGTGAPSPAGLWVSIPTDPLTLRLLHEADNGLARSGGRTQL